MARIFISFFSGIDIKAEHTVVVPAYYESFCNGLKSSGNVVWAIYHRKWNTDWKRSKKRGR